MSRVLDAHLEEQKVRSIIVSEDYKRGLETHNT